MDRDDNSNSNSNSNSPADPAAFCRGGPKLSKKGATSDRIARGPLEIKNQRPVWRIPPARSPGDHARGPRVGSKLALVLGLPLV